MCFNQNLRSQLIIPRPPDRARGITVVISRQAQAQARHGVPGKGAAWHPSSCIREPACMRCCVWDVAHSTNTVHRKGKVRFLGRGPGFPSGGPQTAAWEHPGSDRITSRVEVSCCLRRTWHQPAINSGQVVSPSLVRCTGTWLGNQFENITAIKPTREANPGV